MTTKAAKVWYSEDEAARRLGLSVDQLRVLVRDHVATGDEPSALYTFKPSDLVVLRILAHQQRHVTQ